MAAASAESYTVNDACNHIETVIARKTAVLRDCKVTNTSLNYMCEIDELADLLARLRRMSGPECDPCQDVFIKVVVACRQLADNEMYEVYPYCKSINRILDTYEKVVDVLQ